MFWLYLLSKENRASATWYYTYNADGPVVVGINGEVLYYYEKNLQSDIIAIVDGNDTAVVEYSYDAWGIYDSWEKVC